MPAFKVRQLELVLRLFWEYQHIVRKMKKTEAGLIALRVVQYKIRKNGFEFRPEVFENKVRKFSLIMGCRLEEAREFFKKFILPEVLKGCGIEPNPSAIQPTEQECLWALKVVCADYFNCVSSLSDEVRRICDAMGLNYQQAASLAHHIVTQNLRREFGEKFEPETIEET